MAEDVGAEIVDKSFDENIRCGVSKGHSAMDHKAWREMPGRRLWTEDSMRIVTVVCRGLLVGQ